MGGINSLDCQFDVHGDVYSGQSLRVYTHVLGGWLRINFGLPLIPYSGRYLKFHYTTSPNTLKSFRPYIVWYWCDSLMRRLNLWTKFCGAQYIPFKWNFSVELRYSAIFSKSFSGCYKTNLSCDFFNILANVKRGRVKQTDKRFGLPAPHPLKLGTL